MKLLTQLIILLPAMASANICLSDTPAMEKYKKQKNWQAQTVTESGVKGAVDGFVDENDSFYFTDLSRNNEQPTKLKVSPNNPDYDRFYKFCKNYEERGQSLSHYRELRRGNSYSAIVQYLPDFDEFNNDPYADLQLKTDSFDVIIKYDNDSLVSKAYRPNKAKRDIYEAILSQMTEQKVVGHYNLDLTNLDDFACDLAQGKARINIIRRMFSKAALVTVKENIPRIDVDRLYREWKEQLNEVQDKESKLFIAGSIFEKLQQEQMIQSTKSSIGIKLLGKVMNSSMDKVENLSDSQLSCVSDRMQDYVENPEMHLVNTHFEFNKEQALNQGGH